ncbi:MAG TPA: hypothetical protein VIM08_01210 [Arthrobacter sp.]|jgi:hypothetical protein
MTPATELKAGIAATVASVSKDQATALTDAINGTPRRRAIP